MLPVMDELEVCAKDLRMLNVNKVATLPKNL